MWKVNPRMMCRQHLLGEHLELHMFANNIKLGKRIQGYIDNGLVEVHNIVKRHERLVKEMKRRGFKHKSPISRPKLWKEGSVDVKRSVNDLKKRCKECRKLLKGFSQDLNRKKLL